MAGSKQNSEKRNYGWFQRKEAKAKLWIVLSKTAKGETMAGSKQNRERRNYGWF